MQAMDSCSIEVEQGSIAGLIRRTGQANDPVDLVTAYERVDSSDVFRGPVDDREQQRPQLLGLPWPWSCEFFLEASAPRLPLTRRCVGMRRVDRSRWPGALLPPCPPAPLRRQAGGSPHAATSASPPGPDPKA